MADSWRILGKTGKGRGVITLYALHSLNERPKSGYELLAEIKERSGGGWTPSKGTVYPILKHLKKERLIAIWGVGKRSKNIFEITPGGKKVLEDTRRNRKEHREKFFRFRKLFSSIIGGESAEVMDLVFEIKDAAFGLPAGKKKEVVKALKKCLADLKRIR